MKIPRGTRRTQGLNRLGTKPESLKRLQQLSLLKRKGKITLAGKRQPD